MEQSEISPAGEKISLTPEDDETGRITAHVNFSPTTAGGGRGPERTLFKATARSHTSQSASSTGLLTKSTRVSWAVGHLFVCEGGRVSVSIQRRTNKATSRGGKPEILGNFSVDLQELLEAEEGSSWALMDSQGGRLSIWAEWRSVQ